VLARSLGPGAVVLAGRQVAGRGQRGNRWCDTGDEGLAFSVVLPATDQPQRSQAVAASIVASLDPLKPGTFEVKDPNDVLLDGRKVAGVLIEQADDLAVIGIGINVHQDQWPEELEPIAVSLAQADIHADRLEILERVLPSIVKVWTSD
jgi:BirA family biotin operon repressor/biotin-[acetyl-CoA-carboxylase] ligase